MDKIDLREPLRTLCQPSAKAVVEVEVDVPAFDYPMIDGAGDPSTAPVYAQAVDALFPVSYAARLARGQGLQQVDQAVMPFEGPGWAEGRCAQILHVGPFTEEGPTIARLFAWIAARGRLRG